MVSKKRNSFLKSILVAITLVVIPLSFFWPTWWQGKLPIPTDALVGLYHPYRDYFASTNPQGVAYKNFILTDPVLQQYPWKWLAIDQLRRLLKGDSLKETPLFENPYSFGDYGSSLIENIQAGTFYPLNIVFFIFNNFSTAWTVFIILQPILASWFMYLWLRNNDLSKISSFFGGFVWAFSSFNTVWLEWGNVGHAGLWLPLVLLAVDKIKRKKEKGRRKKVFWHALLQFSLVSSLFAGHLQITLYLIIAVTLYWFLHLGINRHSLTYYILHITFYIILTSPQWYPTAKFTLESNRVIEQADALTREGFFIRPRQLAQTITPDFFGNPATLNYRGFWNYAEQVIYIGVIPLILALAGMVIKIVPKNVVKSTSCSIPFLQHLGIMLVFGGLIFAVKNPIAEIPYKLNIPVWSDLQPTRLSYLTTFGLAILAVVGLQSLADKSRQIPKKAFWTFLVVGLSLLGLLIISSKFDFATKIISQRNLVWPAAMFFIGLFLLTIRLLIKSVKTAFFVFCFLFFSVADLFRFGWKFTPFSPIEYLYPITPAIKFLQDNMRENDRYMTLDRKIMPPNANIIYQLKSIEGYDPIYSREYASLITKMETGKEEAEPFSFGRIIRPQNYRSPIVQRLGVRYALSLSDIADRSLIKVFQEGETRIYEIVSSDVVVE